MEKEWKLKENLGMTTDESQKPKEVIDEARKEGRKIHFASMMDRCHLNISLLEPQYRKHKGRVVLRGDNVKDDSGSYAVFTEQGSSASQMTAARSWISSPDCQVVMDKQQTQYLLIPRLEWRMHPHY